MIGRVFVIMPAYNAAATIELVFARIPEDARRRISGYIVVDDGSRDNTRAALARIHRDFPSLIVLSHPRNLGYGAAEKTLLGRALRERAEAVILLHADGQYSPEKIPQMLEPLDRGEADMVQGSRMLDGGALRGGMPLYKFAANKCLTALENLALRMRLAEYHSGYLAYSTRVLREIPFTRLSDSFEIDLEMMICGRILGLSLREISIPTIYAGEKSYLRPIRYGLDVLRVVRNYGRGDYHRLLGRAA